MSANNTIDAKSVNDLRHRTGASMMECKKALVEANGDSEKAIELLRKKGQASAAKKADRQANEGAIFSYIHNGSRIGVLLELNCETDFVARNENFSQLAKDISMQIAAHSPLYVSREHVPHDLINKEKEIAAAQLQGKPANVVESILQGKLDKWFKEICLTEQPFFKNPDQTISDLINNMISVIGEKIAIGRFTRYQIGE